MEYQKVDTLGSFKIWSDASEMLELVIQIIQIGFIKFSMFVCATVSIVSGAVAERIKIWPFFIFWTAIMAAFDLSNLNGLAVGWWLVSNCWFSDFAGSTLVHACGGAAALAGVIKYFRCKSWKIWKKR